MPIRLWTYKDIYGVRDSPGYAAAHAAHCAAHDLTPETDTHPLVAYVNHNRWLVDCAVCGSGVGVDFDATPPVARCYGCGTIHTAILLPPDRAAIEAALHPRRRAATRNWRAPATVADLEADTAAQEH